MLQLDIWLGRLTTIHVKHCFLPANELLGVVVPLQLSPADFAFQ